MLERLVGNLVDNAVRHNIRGGWMSIRTGTGDGRARFEIANSGPVIPEELVPALFEPFRRVEERTSVRDGAGLGLAIVRSIGTAHGASVEAHSLPAGGLRIVVALPLAGGDGGPAARLSCRSPTSDLVPFQCSIRLSARRCAGAEAAADPQQSAARRAPRPGTAVQRPFPRRLRRRTTASRPSAPQGRCPSAWCRTTAMQSCGLAQATP